MKQYKQLIITALDIIIILVISLAAYNFYLLGSLFLEAFKVMGSNLGIAGIGFIIFPSLILITLGTAWCLVKIKNKFTNVQNSRMQSLVKILFITLVVWIVLSLFLKLFSLILFRILLRK